MGQWNKNREVRNKSTHLRSINLQQGKQEHIMEWRQKDTKMDLWTQWGKDKWTNGKVTSTYIHYHHKTDS